MGQSAVSNSGSEFKEKSSLSCRGSTLENNERELTSTSNETVIVASTVSYPVTSTVNNEHITMMPCMQLNVRRRA